MITDSSTSRRKFVVGGLVTVAAVGVSGCSGGGTVAGGTVSAPSGGSTATTPAVPLTQSEVSVWDGLVGQSFTIAAESGSVLATLASLERVGADINRPAALARQQPFYARFEMDTSLAPAGNKTYTIAHATKGSFDLFVGQPSVVRGKSVIVAALN